MKATDFEFNGRKLSEYGMIICNFGSKGLETISNGSNITFNSVSTLGGSKHNLTSTQYEENLTTTLQICKNSCNSDVMEISSTEFRELTRWLNRKKFLKFKILDEDYIDIYYEASFNISRIEIDGKLYGLELEVVTNRPFALKEERNIVIKNNGGYVWGKFESIAESPVLNSFYMDINQSNEEDIILSKYYQTTTSYVGVVLPPVSMTSDFQDISYSGNIKVIGEEFSLIEPITFKMCNDSDNNSIIGNYIYSTTYDLFGFVPFDAEIIHDKKEYSTKEEYGSIDRYKLTKIVEEEYKISKFIKLSAGSNINNIISSGLVYSDNINEYPISGKHTDGNYYVYFGCETVNHGKHSFNDTSYEEGYIYPYTEITIMEDGNLKIHNAIEDRDTYIANCVAGEMITMDYPIIKSSISSHNIQNDFNWNFFRIANNFNNSRNDLTISLPCKIKLKYSPIVKVGL